MFDVIPLLGGAVYHDKPVAVSRRDFADSHLLILILFGTHRSGSPPPVVDELRLRWTMMVAFRSLRFDCYILLPRACLLYTSDAADDLLCVDLGGRRIIK